MNTCDLTGELLDLWVARAEKLDAIPGQPVGFFYWGESNSGWFNPSINWAIGGPIIENKHIRLDGRDRNCRPISEWAAMLASPRVVFGPTPLIAAMRALVVSKFGETVPDNKYP